MTSSRPHDQGHGRRRQERGGARRGVTTVKDKGGGTVHTATHAAAKIIAAKAKTAEGQHARQRTTS